MGVIFGSWPESLHSEFEQVKRIEAGRKLKRRLCHLIRTSRPWLSLALPLIRMNAIFKHARALTSGSGIFRASIFTAWRMSLVSWLIYRNTEKAADHSILLPSLSDIALCMKLARSAPTHM